MIPNIDDHPRDHALIAKETDWKLSPAYDLTPAVPVSLDRRDPAMDCGDAGRIASASNLLSQSARFLLGRDEATAIMDRMEEHVRTQWLPTAGRWGFRPRLRDDRRCLCGSGLSSDRRTPGLRTDVIVDIPVLEPAARPDSG